MGTAEDGNAFPTRSLTVMPRVRAMSPVHGGPLSGGIHPQDPSPLRFGPGVQDGHRATEAPTPIGYREEMHSARIYQQSQERLVALAADLDERQLATVVPACPDWDVRQTYAHMAGLCVEVAQGLVRPPVDDEVTARQVADRAGRSIQEITTEWSKGVPALLELMGARARARYFLPALDVWHHENDVRGALGMKARTEDSEQLADFVLSGLARGWATDRPSVHVMAIDTGQEWHLGEGADLTLRASAFELARAMTGRRSIIQIRAMDWSGDPTEVVSLLSSLPAPKKDLAI